MENFSKFLFGCVIAVCCFVPYTYSQKTSSKYKLDNNTVVLQINKAKLGITVVSNEIMQVRYTLADAFSNKKSLFIQSGFVKPQFKVSETNNKVIISTAKLIAKVDTKTGQVAFFDQNNQPLLKEKAGGGKTILPSSFENYQTHSVKQVFDSPADEAIYGLGQHQDRLLNIKGYDLDLYQHNTEVYIPFFVSTKGYGLLWNNLSYTKFNHPDSIVAIPANQLFDKDGAQGGLSSSLFKDDAFKEPSQPEEKTAKIALVKEAPVKSARYTGYLLADRTGEYSSYSYVDGTFSLKVNGKLVLNNWAPYANARDMGRINLKKGKKYKIEVATIS